MKRLLTGAAFITVFICGKAQTTAPPAFDIVADSFNLIQLPDSCWQAMADPEGSLTLEGALRAEGFEYGEKKIAYRSRIHWIRYRLTNKTRREIALALPEPASRADLYYRINEGEWQHARTGGLVPWSQRSGLRRIPAFTLTLPAGATATVFKKTSWDYVAVQPDSLAVSLASAGVLISRHYVHDENIFMTSMQDAFTLGLFILSMIISFYFFLVVREKEFLYFSLYLFVASLYSLPTLHDVFLREHPRFLLYLYIFSNSTLAFGLIHSLRQFLKTFKWFPKWDKLLVIFSFIYVPGLLFSFFASSLFRTNLSSQSHLIYNLFMVASAIIVLATLFLYIRHRDSATRLTIVAFTPILCLKLVAYLIAVIHGLYYARLGEPAVSGYVSDFNKVAFFIMILSYLWMIGLFNWVMFRRFSDIRKGFLRQKELGDLKSRFFANISHEFRTPLTLIIGPLEDMMQDGSPEKLTAVLPEMHRNSLHLLRLINQLLDLSRLDSKSYHIRTTRKDIIPFVRQIVHSFSSLAERRKIGLETEIDPALRHTLDNGEASFYFDEDVLEKVLTNLLSNAFKFTSDGGEIRIRMSLYEGRHTFLELKVEDNGAGIPPGKLPYVFDRFYQADHTIRRQHEGSGIGLSLVKELIELHHGKISASSRPGEGSLFTCLFPLNEKIMTGQEETAKTTASPVQPIRPEMSALEEKNSDTLPQQDPDKPIILIIEDHPDVRKYIFKKLENAYTLLEAEDGKEGLDMAMEHIPDLVISDVMMPGMDGFALCKALKSDDHTCHVPIILLTARAEDSDKMAGLETGADAYLIKPFNAKELLIRVRHLILLRNRLRAKFSGKLIIKPGEITVTSRDREFMQKLTAEVEDHIDDSRFSVEKLAIALNMSPSQIYRKLKALINQTPQHFIRSIRMQRALELLRKNAGSISEIAYRVGFEDPGYFSKVFKTHFGFLPSEKDKYTG